MIANLTKLLHRQCVLLLAGLAVACVTHAQSAIRQVPQATGPYVPLYSPCRAKPPADPVARQLYEDIFARREFAYLSSQLDGLRSKPVDALTSIEAEAYFVVLIAIEYQIAMELDAAEAIRAAVIDGRKHGEAISRKFSGDGFVRCAYLASENRIMNALGVRERFGDSDRRKARSDLRTFKERALRGEVAHEMYPDVLRSDIGQAYFDEALELLPDASTAAPLIELGSRFVLDSASDPTDERYLGNWRRYAFMLDKLPTAERLDIAKRLIEHLEKTHWTKPGRRSTALDVYTELLTYAGRLALETKQGKHAVFVFSRHLEVMRELRRRHPDDANFQVKEALVHLLVGDAQVLDGNTTAATHAYRAAELVYETSNAAAVEMLDLQAFPRMLASRREALY